MDNYDTPFEGSTVGETLLTPTKIYIKPVLEVIKNVDVHAICHITGGGFDENIPRVVHDDQGILINEGTWPILPIFKYLEKTGNIPHREMFNVFNISPYHLCVGIKYCLILFGKQFGITYQKSQKYL